MVDRFLTLKDYSGLLNKHREDLSDVFPGKSVANGTSHLTEALDLSVHVLLGFGVLDLANENIQAGRELSAIKDHCKSAHAICCLFPQARLLEGQLVRNGEHQLIFFNQIISLKKQNAESFEDLSKNVDTLFPDILTLGVSKPKHQLRIECLDHIMSIFLADLSNNASDGERVNITGLLFSTHDDVGHDLHDHNQMLFSDAG